MIDRAECWREKCYRKAVYVTVDKAGIPFCPKHAAEVAAEVRLAPVEARMPLPRLVKRDLPRAQR